MQDEDVAVLSDILYRNGALSAEARFLPGLTLHQCASTAFTPWI